MQKEKLSALMDNESLDNEVLSALSEDITLQQRWARWHLVRDALRGELPEEVHLDMATRIASAIKNEPVSSKTTALITEAQPTVEQQEKMPFWRKSRPWVAQMSQAGVAACVSLAVIMGVQHFNRPSQEGGQQSESPAFNTLPMMGEASPVSLGIPVKQSDTTNNPPRQMPEQHHRADVLLQDYELQRRLHSELLQSDEAPLQQTSGQIPGASFSGKYQQ